MVTCPVKQSDPQLNRFALEESFQNRYSTPTINVTAYAREEVRKLDRLRRLAVTGELTKPFAPEDLVRLVERLIDKYPETATCLSLSCVQAIAGGSGWTRDYWIRHIPLCFFSQSGMNGRGS